MIDECETGVANSVLETGCSINDEIGKCADGATNHGGFVSCVANDLKAEGIISGKDKGKIQRCAAQADIP